MNLNFNLTGNVSQQQQLNLAPQLLQWLRLLQVPAQDLELMVMNELQTNPALELDDGRADAASTADDLDLPADDVRDEVSDREGQELTERFEILADIDSQWAAENGNLAGEDIGRRQERMDHQMQSLVSSPCLCDALLRQLTLADASAARKAHAEVVIGMLDARGYLDVSLPDLAAESEIAESALEQALALVQTFEPIGVGARDLRECLLLQLPAAQPECAIARRVVEHYLDALARGQIEGIARLMKVTVEDVRDAVKQIRALDPNPGKSFEEVGMITETVTPDVAIRLNADGEFEIEVAEQSLPRLRISRYCRNLIEQGNLSKSDIAYIRTRIRAASFLIDGIEKRCSTLKRIAEEIVRGQHRYLRGEETAVRPLTMAKVASFIGVHDTTVSRALADKYVATPRGVVPMKQFFCAGYRCDDGSAMTPEMVRREIGRMIREESPACPIKDEDIAARLKDSGIPVARRTVAKYRGELGIESSKVRAVAGRKLRVIKGGQPVVACELPALAMG